MKNYKLHLIRHFATEEGLEGKYLGNTDHHIAMESKFALEEKLEESCYPPCDIIYSSPALRCLETAQLLYPDQETGICDQMAELDFGDFEGKTVAELKDNEDYKAWLLDSLNNPIPNGEDMSSLIARLYKGLDLIFKDMCRREANEAVLITHGGVIMTMLSAFGVPRQPISKWLTKSAEGYTILLNPQMWLRDNLFEIYSKVPFSKEDLFDSWHSERFQGFDGFDDEEI